MRRGDVFAPTPAQVERIMAAHAERVRYEDIGASFGVSGTTIAKIITAHGTPQQRRDVAPGLTQAQRQHLARLERGPAPIVSDPTRQAVLMPGEMLNRQTVAWLQARGLVEVTDGRPRMVTITLAGREALATARAKIARAA